MPSPSSVGRNFSSLNGSMPGNAKDNHWKIPPSKSSAAATTPASSRTRPKQSIPRESHYVILPPEEMPAVDPLLISKINQEQDKGIYSPSKDGPCSLPTAHMISSGSLSSISHPLSALSPQFQADPEDDDYTREAKEQAAWEAAAVLEAQVALVSSAMDVQHQKAKRPRSLSEDSPGREGKISAQASDLKTPALLLLTNGVPSA